MNLVLNARDAMPEGGLLRIDTFERTLAAGNQAVIRVVDTGTGIPEERLSRIFDPFYTTKDAGKGSGLGLATAFGIMAQHGGRITVSSRVGSGTTFEVILPLAVWKPEPAVTVHAKGGAARRDRNHPARRG